jgi:hypothetical protein
VREVLALAALLSGSPTSRGPAGVRTGGAAGYYLALPTPATNAVTLLQQAGDNLCGGHIVVLLTNQPAIEWRATIAGLRRRRVRVHPVVTGACSKSWGSEALVLPAALAELAAEADLISALEWPVRPGNVA